MQQDIIDKVNSYKEECKRDFLKTAKLYVNSRIIEECIDEMKSSNCSGMDGVNSNMLKYGRSPPLIHSITCLFMLYDVLFVLCTKRIQQN